MEWWTKLRVRAAQEDLSKRELCRQEGITYKTLSKVLSRTQPPGYRREAPYPEPKLGPFVERIEEILIAEKALPKKQRHTAQRIFERLVEEGYEGGYTQVREKVAQLRRVRGEVFVPLRHDPGTAQMDVGQALLTAADPPAPSFRLIAVSKVIPLTHIESQNLTKLLPERLAKYVSVDPAASRCLVYAPQETIDTITELIRALDAAPPQVMIEALVLEANAGDVSGFGLTAATTHIAASVSGGIINYQSQGSVNSTDRPTSTGPFPVEDNIFVGLSALMRANKAVLRANPRIVASDGQEAEIQVGAEQYFSLLTGSAAYAYTRLEKVEATIRLTILPRVIPDTGEILCRIEPSVADVAGEGAEGLPVITVRRAKSNVRVKRGHAIVIGGLLQETETRSEARVPVLGDLPIIGKLFRSTRKEAAQRDIILVISPHLLDAEGRCEGPLLSDVLATGPAITSPDQIATRGPAQAPEAESPAATGAAPTRVQSSLGASFHLPQ